MAIQHGHEHELRHHFDDDLDEIRRGLVEMGSLVVENTRRAGDAIIENDMEQIGVVRRGDAEVNQLYRRLEQRNFEILALQQPVATDLRFLVAATRMLYEVERSGDLAVNIVNSLARAEGFPAIPTVHSLIGRLVNESAGLFARAIDALADMDADAGARIEREDDLVDGLTADFFTAINHHQGELGLENAVQLSRIGRYLERIADHAVNIAEHVTYIVTGAFPGDDDAEEGPKD
jgi:phosphate transport system protein